MEGWEERGQSGQVAKISAKHFVRERKTFRPGSEDDPSSFHGPLFPVSCLITTTIVFSTHPNILSYALSPGLARACSTTTIQHNLSRHKHETLRSPQRDATILLTRLPFSSHNTAVSSRSTANSSRDTTSLDIHHHHHDNADWKPRTEQEGA